MAPATSAPIAADGSANSAPIATATTRNRHEPAPTAAAIASISANTRNVRWVPISGISRSAARNVPTSDPAVEIAYSRPVTVPVSATRPTASRFAYGATIPSSSTGTATSTSTAASEPKKPPTDSAPSALTASRRNGSDDERHDREQHRRAEHDHAQAAHVRAAVGEPAADRVADRQRDEHGGDRVRPDDRRGAEIRGEQSGGGDLGAEAGGADAERDRTQPPERDRGSCPHVALTSPAPHRMAALGRRAHVEPKA